MRRIRPDSFSGPAVAGTCLKKSAQRGSSGGFTLIEMIVVMTITGILVAIVAVFIRRPMEGVIDSTRRAALADAADTAARRIRRDLQQALPNSVRVQTTGGVSYIEFIPVLAAGRYCDDSGCGVSPLNTGGGNLNLSFVGPAPAVNPAGTEVVIDNDPIAGLDAYNTACGAACNYQGLAAIGANSLTLTAARTYPFGSPGHRFFITGTPVTYICDPVGGNLTRVSGYAKRTAQPVAVPADATQVAILARSVSACTSNYNLAAIGQYGLINLTLQLAQNGESVTLTHAIQIYNTP
jgi:MSHA biogenesis protein MshO